MNKSLLYIDLLSHHTCSLLLNYNVLPPNKSKDKYNLKSDIVCIWLNNFTFTLDYMIDTFHDELT